MSDCVVCGRSDRESGIVSEQVICQTPQCQRIAVESVLPCHRELSPFPSGMLPRPQSELNVRHIGFAS